MIVGYLRKGGVEDIFGGDVSIDDISHYRHYLRHTFLAQKTQNCGPFLAHFVVFFTGLNNAVAYQKGQLSGMSDDIVARVMADFKEP